ncbi:hypothetical protein K439DRAFT_1191779 [Ramaria rubella]|nr:hypothetical protein K439DRAFT_1191779 [Ramaria rubella]
MDALPRRVTRSSAKKTKFDALPIDSLEPGCVRAPRVPRAAPYSLSDDQSATSTSTSTAPPLHTSTIDLLDAEAVDKPDVCAEEPDRPLGDRCSTTIRPFEAGTASGDPCSCAITVMPVQGQRITSSCDISPTTTESKELSFDSAHMGLSHSDELVAPDVADAKADGANVPSGALFICQDGGTSDPTDVTPIQGELHADATSDTDMSDSLSILPLEVLDAPLPQNHSSTEDGSSLSPSQQSSRDATSSTPIDQDIDIPLLADGDPPASNEDFTTSGSAARDLDTCCPFVADRTDSPESPSLAYFGVDVRFLRFRNPPTSNLAPNPVRRAPRNTTVRRDKFRYLLDATEKAGLLAFAQTRRQFPRWMQRPSRNYFVGSKFIPRGEPVARAELEPEEVGVGMNLDGALASSAARDIFLLPQTDLYPSESSYMTSQVELDPDLDPSSLLNGQSQIFHPQGDLLGAGPSYVSQTSTGYQPATPIPGGRFWTPHPLVHLQDTFSSMQGPHPVQEGSTSPVANRGGGMSSAVARPFADELPWDPTHWASSPQFALFGMPPIPLPPQNMSTDSSLSAMTSYLGNDTHKSFDPDVIDGIPPAPPNPSQFQHLTSASYQPSLSI